MMKKFTLIIMALIGSFFTTQVSAQCITAENTYNNLAGEPAVCFNGTDCNENDGAFAGFGLYGSEAYPIDNIEAGFEYTIDMCSGTGAGAWIPEITIVAADGTTVDAWNGEPATGSTLTFANNCTLNWTATQSGTYTIIVNELGTFSGDAPAQTGCGVTLAVDNGNPLVTCGPTTPALCLPPDFDGAVTAVRIANSELQQNSLANFAHFAVDYSERTTVNIEVDIENIGLMAIDTIILNSFVTEGTFTDGPEWFDTIDLVATPLAPGATYTHTYPTVDLTTAFPLQGSADELYFQVLLDSSSGNLESIGDTVLDLIFAPIESFSVPFTESFEVASGTSFNFDTQTWGWKYLDQDADGNTFGTFSFSNIIAQDGDYQIIGSIIDGNIISIDAVDEVLQSPEFTLTSGTAYSFSVWGRTIFNQAGNFAMSLVNQDGSTPNAFLGTATMTGADSVYQKFNFEVLAAASEDDYMLNIIKGSTGLIALDLVEIQELSAPTAAAALSGLDDPTAMIEYCDSTVSLSVSTTGNPSALSVDWGDGMTEALTINSGGGANATHTYAATGMYTVTVTASNLVASTTATAMFQLTAIPAAMSDVVIVSGPTPQGVVTIINNSTPVCSDVIIDWGDGTTPGNANSTTHTYTASGVYDILVTVSAPGSVDQQTISVTVVLGINDINFTSDFTVFPNPTASNLNVAFGLANAQDISVAVTSTDGKVIETKNFENTADVNTLFNVSKLDAGVYFLSVTTEEGTATERFVVSNK